LWLIIVGCVIKVFIQVELGRFTITHGETPLAALDQVPGPRWKANWIIWYWLAMMLVGLGQLGGSWAEWAILRHVVPLTGDYKQAIDLPSDAELKRFLEWEEFKRDPEGLKTRDPQTFAQLSKLDEVRSQRGHDMIQARLLELDQEHGRGTEALELVRDWSQRNQN